MELREKGVEEEPKKPRCEEKREKSLIYRGITTGGGGGDVGNHYRGLVERKEKKSRKRNALVTSERSPREAKRKIRKRR